METVSPHDVLIHRHQPDIEGETLAPRDRMTGSWSSGARLLAFAMDLRSVDAALTRPVPASLWQEWA
jgi:hypothetical protein